jgi:hypothetical protein
MSRYFLIDSYSTLVGKSKNIGFIETNQVLAELQPTKDKNTHTETQSRIFCHFQRGFSLQNSVRECGPGRDFLLTLKSSFDRAWSCQHLRSEV